MSDEPSVMLQACLDRLRAGDASARNELFQHACQRLERLTRSMLRNYPGVRRWEDTGDVLQNAMLRLCRALGEVPLPTVRDFYRVAALQVRRELIDLARHYYGPQGAGAHHASLGPEDGQGHAPPALEQADVTHEPGRVALWTEFHRQVEALPAEEREVFDLLYYQGLKQEQAAAVVGVTVRTIKSRWRDVRLKLHEALGGELPGI